MKNARKYILALTVSLPVISSCSAGPDYERPEIPVVKKYTQQELPTQTSSAEVGQGKAQTFVMDKEISPEWWKVFGSAKLDEFVCKALAANHDIQAAEARLRQTQENLSAQRGSSYPSIDANFDRSRQKFSNSRFGQSNSPSTIFTLYNASVDVSYGIDIFGRLRRAVESLEAQEEAERFRYEATYLALTTNIVTAAVQEASLRQQLEETQNIIDVERQRLKMLEKQFELGGIAKQPVLAQSVNLAQVEASISVLQKQLAQQRNQLAVLAGVMPSENSATSFELADLKLPDELPVSLPSNLVEQRPDIKAAEALLKSANAQIGIATANMLPKISLTGSYGSATSSLSDLFDPSTIIWNFVSGVTQPIFHGGELLHQKRAAVAAYDEAVAEYKGTVLNAFANVSDSLTALQYDAEQLKAQANAAQAAEKNLEILSSQYKYGSVSNLALLDAQRSYQQSQIALVQARAMRIADTAALYQSLGGGWWNKGKEIEISKEEVQEEKVVEKIVPIKEVKPAEKIEKAENVKEIEVTKPQVKAVKITPKKIEPKEVKMQVNETITPAKVEKVEAVELKKPVVKVIAESIEKFAEEVEEQETTTKPKIKIYKKPDGEEL